MDVVVKRKLKEFKQPGQKKIIEAIKDTPVNSPRNMKPVYNFKQSYDELNLLLGDVDNDLAVRFKNDSNLSSKKLSHQLDNSDFLELH